MKRSDKGRKRRGYHHGNLRETLVQAALALIGDKGSAGFTFADAARWAGVSPAAPYRHFRDRDDLMADVAKRGFERFTAHLAKAWNEGRPEPYRAFENIGRAYLSFARNETAYYAAMFESRLPLDSSPELAAAGDEAFAVLRRATEALCNLMPEDERPPVLMMSLHFWSLLHGIASLFARGDAARRPLPMPPEELLESALLVYLGGLGPPGDGKP